MSGFGLAVALTVAAGVLFVGLLIWDFMSPPSDEERSIY